MKPWLALAVLSSILASASLFTQPAFADLANPTCLELANCTVNWQAPLEWLVYPLEAQMGPVIHLMIWGSVLGVIQIKGQNPMLTGVVGLVIFAGLVGSNIATNSDTAQFLYWGQILLVVSIGCVLFYLVFIKLRSGF